MAIKSGYTAEDLAKLGPDVLTRKRLLAEAMLNDSTKQRKIAHPLQGLQQLAETLVNGLDVRKIDKATMTGQEAGDKDWSSLFGVGSSSSSMPAPAAAGEMSSTSPSPSIDISGDKQTFISSLLPAAIEESKRTGVDPRIIVAQAAQESGWGKSAPGNNYFGIKSHGQEGGQTLPTNEVVDGKTVRINDSFRQFSSPEDSVKGYGDFILQNPRYRGLREAKGLDAQLEALGASGYATDPNYANSVGSIARSITLPQEVASLDPGAGMSAFNMPAPAAQAQIQGPQPPAPPLPPPTTVPNAPQVAAQPPVSPQGSPDPQQLAQALTGQSSVPSPPQGPSPQDLAKILSNPWVSDERKQVARMLLGQQGQRQQAQYEQQLKMSDPKYRQDLEKGGIELENLRNPKISPTDQANIDLSRDKFELDKENSAVTPDIKEYKFAKGNGYTGSFAQYQIDMKKSAANNTTINTGEGNKFYNTLDEKNAGIFSGLSDTGIQARSTLGQIDALDNLLKASSTGWVGAMKQAAGEYGINTEGLSDIQAATALINKMVPTQRQPGSGTMSDADLALFKQSLPRIINQPGGNATIINTIRGISQYQVQMGEIADRVANRELTPSEGRSAIAALPNPLSNFKAPPPGKEEEGWTTVPTDVPGVTIRRKN